MTVVPPPEPEPGGPARLTLGAVLRLGRDAEGREAQLGLASVQAGPPIRADLRVMLGPLAIQVVARQGLVVPVGRGLVELLAVDPVKKAVELRWPRPLPDDPAAWDLVSPHKDGEGGRTLLREMSFCRLPDGVWVAVGNVAVGALRDGRLAESAWLHVYPPTYVDDPLQDYDRHQAVAGAALDGKVLRLTVEQVEPGDVDARRFGFVAVRVRKS